MDLHQLAENDLAFTLERDGQSVTLIDPNGVSAEVPAISNDISLLIDPDTGAPVSGRNVSVALRLSRIRNAGLEVPKGIEDGARVPWCVEYTTIEGVTVRTKVVASNPDRSVGVVTLRLELIA